MEHLNSSKSRRTQAAKQPRRKLRWLSLLLLDKCRIVWLSNLLALLAVTFNSTSSIGHALLVTNLDLPSAAFQGDTIQLACAFALDSKSSAVLSSSSTSKTFKSSSTLSLDRPNQNWRPQRPTTTATLANADVDLPLEALYAVKWYKDDKEFFHFIANDWPQKFTFPLDGVHVDLERSGNQSVTLRNISLKTSGTFKCEVSTDAPTFITKAINRTMQVYTLPNEGPRIETTLVQQSKQVGVDGRPIPLLFVGDQLELRCASRDSKPAATLDWIIDDKINLSASKLFEGQTVGLAASSSLFQVQPQRNFVRLPVTLGSGSGSGSGSLETPAGSSSSSLQTFELDTQQPVGSGMILARPMDKLATSGDGSSSGSGSGVNLRPISLTNKSLDQMVEFSTTTMIFSVTPDLIRWLQMTTAAAAAVATSTTTTNDNRSNWRNSTPSVRRSRGHVKQPQSDAFQRQVRSQPHQVVDENSLLAFNNNWRRRMPTAQSNAQKTRQLTSTAPQMHGFVLKISCNARVLHLNMSDGLKIKIINKTRAELDQQQAHANIPNELPYRSQTHSNNASMEQYNPSFGIILSVTIINIIVSSAIFSSKNNQKPSANR